MSDLISRQDVVSEIDVYIQSATDNETDMAIKEFLLYLKERIDTLPSSDGPTGEWQHLGGDEWLCSNCGYVVWTEGSWEHPLERGKDYCEHCGARMDGKEQKNK